MSLVIGDFRALEPVDPSDRRAVVRLYRAEHVGSGGAVTMAVLPADLDLDISAMVDEVEDVRHSHLLSVDDVVWGADRQALIFARPDAGRLSDMLLRRKRLDPAETVTVVVPLATALAAAHSVRLRHTDVGAATVWLDGTGRPMLAPLALGRIVTALNGGLPSNIGDVAPEVIRAERRGPPLTPAADVFSLGSVALRCLTGRPAWPADDPADVLVQSAAGLWPDLPADAGPPELVALVRAMLSAEPDDRPTAADVLERLAGSVAPQPISLGPVRAARARHHWGGSGTPMQVDPKGEVPADRANPGKPADEVDPDQRRPVRRRTTAPGGQVGPSRRARAGISVLAALLIAVVALQVGLWWTGFDRPDSTDVTTESAALDPAAPIGPHHVGASGVDWATVIVDLDAARARALAAADESLLGEVYLTQSPAEQADARTIEQLAAQGWTVQDGVHEITEVTVDETSDGDASPDWVKVAVTDSLPARVIVDRSGQAVGATTSRPAARRILTLVSTPAGFRIGAVEPG